ncbi:MAG: metal-sensitive transcriptional regulator [Anaerolineae bacterium]|jgi:CsoR family transcriptional regulator, copper-sensing transcriptional repressor|nr:metal-sensitive transcriptional regulator [Anaerolineae bacterium]MBT3391749.1 metal-sensitive transcriptional regulator [Chloroflexota bacterium]
MMKHEDALKRLKNVEGHVRGIQRMIEEDKYCIDVIHQVHAVQSALNKISSMILDDHLNTCLISAVRGENPDERERVLREVTEIFEAATKV